MSHNQLDTLIRMINQIAANNGAYQTDEAAERVAAHIKRFWARSMKQLIIEHNQSGGGEPNPIAKLAVEKLEMPARAEDQDTLSVG